MWFPEGGLNASYNCVDRWAFKNPDKTAIIYEADEPGEGYTVSYGELFREVCRIANVLKEFGIRKGDTVSIYLPMTWHAAAAFLACARIGAVHSVVFAGFSAESLRDRVRDCESRVLITTDEGRRGGKTIATKAIVDAALKECPTVEHVLVLKRTGKPVPWTDGRDKWWHEEAAKVQAYCPPEIMASEDPLFILYVCIFRVLSMIITDMRYSSRLPDQQENQRVSFTQPVVTYSEPHSRSNTSLMCTRMTSSLVWLMSVGLPVTATSFTDPLRMVSRRLCSSLRLCTLLPRVTGNTSRNTRSLSSTVLPLPFVCSDDWVTTTYLATISRPCACSVP